MILAVVAHLRVHALRRPPQGELPQGHEIALAEEVRDCAFRGLWQVDLALAQTLQEIVRRQVHQLHFVRLVEEGVGHRFEYADTGDAADHVADALEVLDVERRVDVDAGVEQLLDVLPALGVPAAGGVRVRQLVDEDQGRVALECGVEVELADRRAAIWNLPGRQDLEILEKGAGFLAAVGLDEPDDDVMAVVAQLPGRLAASRRSCRRRPRRRRRSSAGRA